MRATVNLAEIEQKPPVELLQDLLACEWEGSVIGGDGVAEISRLAGAYVLLVGIEREVTISRKGRQMISLKAGWYAYCGSAKGPGGLKARVGRHFKPDKTRHWHIDHLTDGEATLAVLTVAGGDECALIKSLVESGAFTPAVPGFGSSDCRTCKSHLMMWHGADQIP